MKFPPSIIVINMKNISVISFSLKYISYMQKTLFLHLGAINVLFFLVQILEYMFMCVIYYYICLYVFMCFICFYMLYMFICVHMGLYRVHKGRCIKAGHCESCSLFACCQPRDIAADPSCHI